MSTTATEHKLPTFAPMPLEDIAKVREELQRGFASGKTRSVAWRRAQILALVYLIKDNIDRFNAALALDLGRSPLETHIAEVGPTLDELRVLYDGVAKWAKTESAPFSTAWFPMKPQIRKEPKGVVLVITPFNYVITLSMCPIAGALAAGCTVAFKPSEQTPHASALFAELMPKYVDTDVVRVVNGAIPETTKLLEYQWDHIMYTGSGRVARIVLTAAAKTLSPVTTELGGKSPAIFGPRCNLKTSVRRVLWAKFANSGQTCIAPDYAIVPKSLELDFIDEIRRVLPEFYPDGAERSSSFSRIVSFRGTARLHALLQNTKGETVCGGRVDVEARFVEPTVVRGVGGDDSLMSEYAVILELFGPILPIVTVDDVDEAIAFVKARDHPLALYVFSEDKEFQQKIIESTQSGGVLVNDTMVHFAAYGVPFGGIGPSGSGQYKGKYSFDMFTHLRTVLVSASWLDIILSGRYPPFSAAKARKMDMLTLPSFPSRPKVPPVPSEVPQSSTSRWGAGVVVALVVSMTALLTRSSHRRS
ncbi:NAD-aldehyde dehydrogenase [Vararia minispora EC-137]|uniref:NAD-aldehyde dehydrogenase n=1 Tax=Vararia minispora EC-137 TaxID=1314806 RepID=A0ACB8QVD7_9AGAM|nr:NAD-aldehyde dehydrogenase [Vararia minispora EC-137]